MSSEEMQCCDNCRFSMLGVVKSGLYCGLNDIEVYQTNTCSDYELLEG